MGPAVIWIALTLTCSGHTNSECYPSIKTYQTQEQCEAARVIPAVEGFWGRPARIDDSTVCIPAPAPPAVAREEER